MSPHNWLVHWIGKRRHHTHDDEWTSLGRKQEGISWWSPVPPQCLHRQHFQAFTGRNITVLPRAGEWYRRVIYRFACFIATRTRPYSGCTWLVRISWPGAMRAKNISYSMGFSNGRRNRMLWCSDIARTEGWLDRTLLSRWNGAIVHYPNNYCNCTCNCGYLSTLKNN